MSFMFVLRCVYSQIMQLVAVDFSFFLALIFFRAKSKCGQSVK